MTWTREALTVAASIFVGGCAMDAGPDGEITSEAPGTRDEATPVDDLPAPRDAGDVGTSVDDPAPPAAFDPIIGGIAIDADSSEGIAGAGVYASVDYLTNHGTTNGSGRFAVPGIIGFDHVEVTFVASGYPLTQVVTPLYDGVGWVRAKLVSEAALAQFRAPLGRGSAPTGATVIIQSAFSSEALEGHALTASHLDPANLRDGHATPLEVVYADPGGTADAELDAMSSRGLAAVLNVPAGWVTLSVDDRGPCVFHDELEPETTLLVSDAPMTLVSLVCREEPAEP